MDWLKCGAFIHVVVLDAVPSRWLAGNRANDVSLRRNGPCFVVKPTRCLPVG